MSMSDQSLSQWENTIHIKHLLLLDSNSISHKYKSGLVSNKHHTCFNGKPLMNKGASEIYFPSNRINGMDIDICIRAPWRLKSPTNRLFVHLFFVLFCFVFWANSEQNIRVSNTIINTVIWIHLWSVDSSHKGITGFFLCYNGIMLYHPTILFYLTFCAIYSGRKDIQIFFYKPNSAIFHAQHDYRTWFMTL